MSRCCRSTRVWALIGVVVGLFIDAWVTRSRHPSGFRRGDPNWLPSGSWRVVAVIVGVVLASKPIRHRIAPIGPVFRNLFEVVVRPRRAVKLFIYRVVTFWLPIVTRLDPAPRWGVLVAGCASDGEVVFRGS